MINIKFPDGSVRTYEAGVTGYDVAMSISPYEAGVTGYDVAMSISPRLAADVLAVSVKKPGEPETSKGTTIDLLRPINEDVELRLLKWEDDEAKKVFWHSSSHLMAEALEALFPGVKFGIGPAIENGFYYDVDMNGRTLWPTSPRRATSTSRNSSPSWKTVPSHTTRTASSRTCAAARTSATPRSSRPSRCSPSPAPTGAVTRPASSSPASTASPSPRSRCWTSTW